LYKQKPEREALGRTLLEMQRAGMTRREMASKAGMTIDAVGGLLRTAKLKSPNEFDVVHLGTPLEITGDFMALGDPHVPCTDYEFAELVIRVAVKHSIKRLIVAGGLFSMDVFSSYDAIVPQPSWSQERDAAKFLFRQWLEWFDEVTVVMGITTAGFKESQRGHLTKQISSE